MIIVFGNTKGGSGKSTLAVHTAVDLMYRGLKVRCVDTDGDQGTMARYWENRQHYCTVHSKSIPLPVDMRRFSPSKGIDEMKNYMDATSLAAQEVMIIDTAGYDSPLSRYAHCLADILVTPMNDSAIDLDLLVNIKDTKLKPDQLPLSQYAHLVWEQRMRKVMEKSGSLEWIVVRNRMHTLTSRNQIQLEKILQALAGRIGFHMAPGVKERVIFRELFPYGLTVMDQKPQSLGSYASAYGEIQHITEKILALRTRQR